MSSMVDGHQSPYWTGDFSMNEVYEMKEETYGIYLTNIVGAIKKLTSN